jgi:hypothetical protein
MVANMQLLFSAIASGVRQAGYAAQVCLPPRRPVSLQSGAKRLARAHRSEGSCFRRTYKQSEVEFAACI